MTQSIEIIAGHSYFVMRDDAGQIVSQQAQDVPPPITAVLVFGSSERTSVKVLAQKDPGTATLADIAAMLQLLLKKTLSE